MLTKELINYAWEHATKVNGYNPSVFRKDCCGAWIVKSAYGNLNSPFGWEVDHVYPISRGGDDHLVNLRAMQWENNRSKGDSYPTYRVVMQSDDNKVKRVDIQLVVNDALQVELNKLYKL